MVSKNSFEEEFGDFDINDSFAAMQEIIEAEETRQQIVTQHPDDRCYKCNEYINPGQGIGIHKPNALVYGHGLLSTQEAENRQKELASRTMTVTNMAGSTLNIAGVSASSVAVFCGLSKFATAQQLAGRGIQAANGVRVFSAGADKVAKVSTGLKAGGKALGVAGGVLSIGIGIYDLARSPNQKCEECKGNMAVDFCKRQCIACWTRNDPSVVPMDSNVVSRGKRCAVICQSCNDNSDIVGNPRHCFICFETSGELRPAHRELYDVHPRLKNSATQNTGAGLGIASGALAVPACLMAGPLGWAVLGTSLAAGAASATAQLACDNDPNCFHCGQDCKTPGCQALCRSCGKLGDRNGGHPSKCAWAHPECYQKAGFMGTI